MFAIGQSVRGRFAGVTRYSNRGHAVDLSNVSGANFDLEGNVRAWLPISHAMADYSDHMARRRLDDLALGSELDLEIIGIPGDGRSRSITVSEQVHVARQLLGTSPRIYEVVVSMPERQIGNGIQVQFPGGIRFNLPSRQLKGGSRRSSQLLRGETLLIRCYSVDTVDPKWRLCVQEVAEGQYPETPVIRRDPPEAVLMRMLDEIPPGLDRDALVRYLIVDSDENGRWPDVPAPSRSHPADANPARD